MCPKKLLAKMDSLTRSSKSFSRGSHLHCTEADEPTIILAIATCTETDANRCEPGLSTDHEVIFVWFWRNLWFLRLQRSEFVRENSQKSRDTGNSAAAIQKLLCGVFKVNFQSTEYKLPTGGFVWKKTTFFEPVIETSWHALKEPLATYETCKKKTGWL